MSLKLSLILSSNVHKLGSRRDLMLLSRPRLVYAGTLVYTESIISMSFADDSIQSFPIALGLVNYQLQQNPHCRERESIYLASKATTPESQRTPTVPTEAARESQTRI